VERASGEAPGLHTMLHPVGAHVHRGGHPQWSHPGFIPELRAARQGWTVALRLPQQQADPQLARLFVWDDGPV